MIIYNEGLEEGRKRYGTIKNSDEPDHRYNPVTEDGKCVECGKGKAAHEDARENASGRLLTTGGDSDEVAFVHCQTCDEGIEEKRIQDHLTDGHTVEKVMKVERENAAGCGVCGTMPAQLYLVDGDRKLLCDECAKKMHGELLNACPAPHCGAVRTDRSALTLHLMESHGLLQNDAQQIGYQFGTTTTTEHGQHCDKCGHVIGQVFADGLCTCSCHGGRENMACPVCRKEEGAALLEHLQEQHGMDLDDAKAVTWDTDRREKAGLTNEDAA